MLAEKKIYQTFMENENEYGIYMFYPFVKFESYNLFHDGPF
jgi:hypothetical protein